MVERHSRRHGGTPVKDREHMVDRFQSGATPVLVLSLKAAGTGLNLTRAGHVVHDLGGAVGHGCVGTHSAGIRAPVAL